MGVQAASQFALHRSCAHNFLAAICPAEDDMAVSWSKDVDQALADARQDHCPVLLDFSAAPA
jgi:thiol:disulfide interchange protein